jgi:hypothetical protein
MSTVVTPTLRQGGQQGKNEKRTRAHLQSGLSVIGAPDLVSRLLRHSLRIHAALSLAPSNAAAKSCDARRRRRHPEEAATCENSSS